MKNENLKISLLAILACFLWSNAFVGIKIGLQYTTPIQFAGIRFMISGLMILPLIKQKKRYFTILKTNWRFILQIAVFQTFFQYLFFYLGIARVPGSMSAIIIGAGPLFIAIMAHFFMPNDKLNMEKSLAIVLGFSGITLVALSKNSSISSGVSLIIGIVFLLICNLNGAYTNIFIAKNKQQIPPLILSSSSLFLGGVFLTLSSLPFESISFSNLPFEYYASLFWLSTISAGAISIWIYLLQKPGIVVSNLNMWKFIIPVIGAILAWIILPTESPSLIAIIGMLLTATGLIWVNIINRKKRNSQNQTV